MSKVLFLVLAFGFSWADILNCENPPDHQCDFYEKCLEARKPCGLQGYALGFGKRNCEKFLKLQKTISPDGQFFLSLTRVCLQNRLAVALKKSNLSCSQMSQIAYDSHTDCYTNHAYSICNLNPVDLSKILFLMEPYDLLQSQSLGQVSRTLSSCLAHFPRAPKSVDKE